MAAARRYGEFKHVFAGFHQRGVKGYFSLGPKAANSIPVDRGRILQRARLAGRLVVDGHCDVPSAVAANARRSVALPRGASARSNVTDHVVPSGRSARGH